MRARFGCAQARVADFEHVGIVPVAGAGVLLQTHLQLQNKLPAERVSALAIVAIHDVAGGAPQMTDVFGPGPGLGVAPFAQAEDDRPAGGVDRITHRLISLLGVRRAVIAPVVLQIVDSPGGVREGVLKLVAAAAGQAGAGLGSGAVVDAEQETVRVQVIANRFHAVRETLGVGNQIALGVPLRGLPTVVNHDVPVARLLHSAGDDGVGHFFDQAFADVALEGVPTVPSHGRRGSQPFEFLRQRRRGEADQQ